MPAGAYSLLQCRGHESATCRVFRSARRGRESAYVGRESAFIARDSACRVLPLEG
jgi:hypothetical protein